MAEIESGLEAELRSKHRPALRSSNPRRCFTPQTVRLILPLKAQNVREAAAASSWPASVPAVSVVENPDVPGRTSALVREPAGSRWSG